MEPGSEDDSIRLFIDSKTAFEWVKNAILNYTGDTMKFSDMHLFLEGEMGSHQFRLQGKYFPKKITRWMKKIVADKGLGIPIYGKSGKRAIGIKFTAPPPAYEESKQEIEESSPPEEIDLLTLGKSVDRFISELKKKIHALEDLAEISKNRQTRIETDLRQANKDKDRTIEKLNRQITNLNNLLASDDRKNKSAGFKLSELASFK
jgi:hypothetical protein